MSTPQTNSSPPFLLLKPTTNAPVGRAYIRWLFQFSVFTMTTEDSKSIDLIRWRNANVWDYYKEVRRIGEGSIGVVSLVRRKRGTEGGSAYNSQRVKGNIVSVGCRGLFGCLLPKRTPPGIEKTSDVNGGQSRRGTPSSCHSEEYALKSIQLGLVERKYLDELRNEINVLRSLDHPNIVKAYEVYETRSPALSTRAIYVLMEYCSGKEIDCVFCALFLISLYCNDNLILCIISDLSRWGFVRSRPLQGEPGKRYCGADMFRHLSHA